MNTSPTRVLLSTEGFASTAALAWLAETKAEKLLRLSAPRVDLVRSNVKRRTPHSGAAYFTARAIAESEGPDHIAHADAAEPETALLNVVRKLLRSLSTEAKSRRYARYHPHATELGARVPKAV